MFARVAIPIEWIQQYSHNEGVMSAPFDLRDSQPIVSVFLKETVEVFRAVARRDDVLASRFDISYWLGDGGPGPPYALLNVDTRPGSQPDGRYTYHGLRQLDFDNWAKPLDDGYEKESYRVIGIDGRMNHCVRVKEVSELIMLLLVESLLTAREEGVFRTLPRHDRCEVGVEEIGGRWGWPNYKDRGNQNLI